MFAPPRRPPILLIFGALAPVGGFFLVVVLLIAVLAATGALAQSTAQTLCPFCVQGGDILNRENRIQQETTPTERANRIATTAGELQRHLSGQLANIYDPNAPFMKPVYAYWRDVVCGGTICDVAKSGNLQCTQFVRAVYHLAGHDLPVWGNAIDYWDLYENQPGWKRIPVGSSAKEHRPLVGDIVVWEGGSHGYGHVAIIVSTAWPEHKTPYKSYVNVAQANSQGNQKRDPAAPGNFYAMDLHDDYSLSTWEGFRVLGYIRPV